MFCGQGIVILVFGWDYQLLSVFSFILITLTIFQYTYQYFILIYSTQV